MYRPTDIQNGLFHLWGWRPHYDPQEITISDSLIISETGQYYQDLHPLLTLPNLVAIAPDFSKIVFSDWSDVTFYRIGDRVKKEGRDFKCLIDNTGKDPVTNPSYWEVFNHFSEWLEIKTKASILKAIRSFWDQKISERSARNILEKKALFNGTGRVIDQIKNTGHLVGFEIIPLRTNGITLKIESIGTQMSGQGPLTLYLMHSSRRDPVKTITINRIRNGGMEWTQVQDFYLPYSSSDINPGGSWYLVYKQDELPTGVQAINMNKDWSAKPCLSCDSDEYTGWNIWSQYLEIHPFKTSDLEGDFNGDFNEDFDSADLWLWDVSKNLYCYTNNWGLNLKISLECDITDLVLEEKYAFQSIVGLQVAIDMLREIAYNPNFKINRTNQNFSRQELLYELDGDSQSPKKSGLRYDYQKALEAVKLDLTNFSKVCFPCANKGIKYKPI